MQVFEYLNIILRTLRLWQAVAKTSDTGVCMPTIRRVIDPHDPAIKRFGLLQNQTYFEPDSLIPAQYIAEMLHDNHGSRYNILLVAEDDAGAVVAGTFFHYLAAANIGFSSYLAVTPALRGQGLARKLHNQRFALLDQMAQQAGKPQVAGLLIDVVAPERLNAHEQAAEQALGFDASARRRAFAHMGFMQVAVAYQQPSGGPTGGPITNMDLLFAPHPSQSKASSVATSLVCAAMLAYWAPWLGLKRAQAAAKALSERANGAEIALVRAD
jgi:GNAT superfamily N-acetyltransferase